MLPTKFSFGIMALRHRLRPAVAAVVAAAVAILFTIGVEAGSGRRLALCRTTCGWWQSWDATCGTGGAVGVWTLQDDMPCPEDEVFPMRASQKLPCSGGRPSAEDKPLLSRPATARNGSGCAQGESCSASHDPSAWCYRGTICPCVYFGCCDGPEHPSSSGSGCMRQASWKESRPQTLRERLRHQRSTWTN